MGHKQEQSQMGSADSGKCCRERFEEFRLLCVCVCARV